MKLSKSAFAVASALALSAIGVSQLDTILKGAGIYAIIQKLGPQINKGINGVTKHSDSSRSYTKVVPIISFGSGTAAGAAQVMGSQSQVEKVTSVLQMEGKALGAIRFKALIPIASKDPRDTPAVDGVGVSGLVDIKL